MGHVIQAAGIASVQPAEGMVRAGFSTHCSSHAVHKENMAEGSLLAWWP